MHLKCKGIQEVTLQPQLQRNSVLNNKKEVSSFPGITHYNWLSAGLRATGKANLWGNAFRTQLRFEF